MIRFQFRDTPRHNARLLIEHDATFRRGSDHDPVELAAVRDDILSAIQAAGRQARSRLAAAIRASTDRQANGQTALVALGFDAREPMHTELDNVLAAVRDLRFVQRMHGADESATDIRIAVEKEMSVAADAAGDDPADIHARVAFIEGNACPVSWRAWNAADGPVDHEHADKMDAHLVEHAVRGWDALIVAFQSGLYPYLADRIDDGPGATTPWLDLLVDAVAMWRERRTNDDAVVDGIIDVTDRRMLVVRDQQMDMGYFATPRSFSESVGRLVACADSKRFSMVLPSEHVRVGELTYHVGHIKSVNEDGRGWHFRLPHRQGGDPSPLLASLIADIRVIAKGAHVVDFVTAMLQLVLRDIYASGSQHGHARPTVITWQQMDDILGFSARSRNPAEYRRQWLQVVDALSLSFFVFRRSEADGSETDVQTPLFNFTRRVHGDQAEAIAVRLGDYFAAEIFGANPHYALCNFAAIRAAGGVSSRSRGGCAKRHAQSLVALIESKSYDAVCSARKSRPNGDGSWVTDPSIPKARITVTEVTELVGIRFGLDSPCPSAPGSDRERWHNANRQARNRGIETVTNLLRRLCGECVDGEDAIAPVYDASAWSPRDQVWYVCYARPSADVYRIQMASSS